MSFAGIAQFRANLATLRASDAFKNADPGTQLQMGYRLVNSRFGARGLKVDDLRTASQTTVKKNSCTTA